MSKSVPVSDADFPTLIDEVAKTKEEIVITKDGEPVVRLIPAGPRRQMTLEEIRKSVLRVGDIEKPILGEWDMETW